MRFFLFGLAAFCIWRNAAGLACPVIFPFFIWHTQIAHVFWSPCCDYSIAFPSWTAFQWSQQYRKDAGYLFNRIVSTRIRHWVVQIFEFWRLFLSHAMGNSLSAAPISTIGGNLPSFCPDAHRLFLPDFILNHLKEIIKHFTNKRTDSSAPIPWNRNYS
jgi:hypothetical protein